MSSVQVKKLPQLMFLALSLQGLALILIFVGGWYAIRFFLDEGSKVIMTPEIWKSVLIGFFYASSGLSLSDLTGVLAEIAEDYRAFFVVTSDSKSSPVRQIKLQKAWIFFSLFAFGLLFFIHPYDTNLFTILALCICINIWCLVIIFYHRNVVNKLIKSSE